MNLPLTGGCVCGAVRYAIDAEPVLMLKCHCRDCQRISGGPYIPALIVALPAFRLTRGALRKHAMPREQGGENMRGFCLECGSRITGAEDAGRGIIGVVASSLDDPGIFAPRLEMFVADAQPWGTINTTIPNFPGHFQAGRRPRKSTEAQPTGSSSTGSPGR